MAQIIPAILSRRRDEIFEKLEFLGRIAEISEVQIDFADGQFVQSTTALPNELGGMRTRLGLEAHLMVINPTQHVNHLEQLHFQFVYFHYESFRDYRGLQTALRNAKAVGLKAGVALNPETSLDVVPQFISDADAVLVMGVHPGLQGKPFIPETLERVEILRKRHENAIIEVDGGVNLANAEALVAHGANRLVVGSAIWQTPNPEKTIRELIAKLK